MRPPAAPVPVDWATQFRLVGPDGLVGLPDGVWLCPECDGTGTGGWDRDPNRTGLCLPCRGNGRFQVRKGEVWTEVWEASLDTPRLAGRFTEKGPGA